MLAEWFKRGELDKEEVKLFFNNLYIQVLKDFIHMTIGSVSSTIKV